MTPRRGPTKKLIPAISSESKCQHAFTEDDGLQLEVDCSTCQGAQDLGNRKCMSGILNVMISATTPNAIILKRYIHKRYRGDSVRRMIELAQDLASISRAASSAEGPSDRRCRTCPASTERILRTVRRKLLEDPASYTGDSAWFGRVVNEVTEGVDCGNAPSCKVGSIAIMMGKTAS